LLALFAGVCAALGQVPAADAQFSYGVDGGSDFMMEMAGANGRMFTLSAGGVDYDERQAVKLGDGAVLAVKFTAPPVDPGFSIVKSMISLAPAPFEFSYRIEGNRIIANVGIEQERLYKVTLDPSAIRDSEGHPPANRKPSSFFIYQPRLAPFAEWESGAVIMERFGPQGIYILARNVPALDLRVYKIDPLDAPLNQNYTVEMGNRIINDTSSVGNQLIDNNVEIENYIKTLGNPHYSEIITIDKEGIGDNRGIVKRHLINLKPIFASISGKDKSGSYLVGFTLPDGSDSLSYARVDVTDLCLTTIEADNRALFVVTSFTNGKALVDAVVKVEGIVDNKLVVLEQGKTKTDGVFAFENTPERRKKFNNARLMRVVISRGDDMLVLDAGESGAMRVLADNHWYRRYHGGDAGNRWLQWLGFDRGADDPRADNPNKYLRGFVRTDRLVYGPEDTVFIKGYAREAISGAAKRPRKFALSVRVQGPSGAYTDHEVILDTDGSNSGGFGLKVLPHEFMIGRHKVSLISYGGDIAETEFFVADYAPPLEAGAGGKERARESGHIIEPQSRAYSKDTARPQFTLRLRASRYITSGSTISARVSAVGKNDSLIVGQTVTARLSRVSWTSRLEDSDFSSGNPKYVPQEVVTLVGERKVSTVKKNPTLIEFKNQAPGVYILEVSSQDKQSRSLSEKVDIYLAAGKQQRKKADRGVFEAMTDRNFYEPSQQAKILLRSPYQRTLALAVIEKPGGDIQYKWVNISNWQGTFTLDIKPDMAPRIPVSFLLMAPRTPAPRRPADGDKDTADIGKPETIINTAWIAVSPVANTLDIRLMHAPLVTPGSTLDVTVSIRDNQGKAKPGEVALWLVDETSLPHRAMQAYRKELDFDPLDAFLDDVDSRVTIRDLRNLAPVNLNIANDNSNINSMADDSSNVSDESSWLENIAIRKNPKAVPYWNPSIKIDKSGNAVVRISIPNDLTSYSIRAIAVGEPDKFGTAASRVSVREK
jgi:uncharacterized protein YfaS (alpha-2-macroglobulin family)